MSGNEVREVEATAVRQALGKTEAAGLRVMRLIKEEPAGVAGWGLIVYGASLLVHSIAELVVFAVCAWLFWHLKGYGPWIAGLSWGGVLTFGFLVSWDRD